MTVTSRRSIATSAPRLDLLQDIYVKEIKGFKPAPVSAKDAAAETIPWSVPKAPAVPSGEIALDQIDEYAKAPVEVEHEAPVATEGQAQTVDTSPGGDWFVVEPVEWEDHDDHH